MVREVGEDPRERAIPGAAAFQKVEVVNAVECHRPDRPANRRTYGCRCVPKRVHTPAHTYDPVCASLCTLTSDSPHVCCGQTACGGLWNRQEINRKCSPPKRSFQSSRGGESVTCGNRRQQGNAEIIIAVASFCWAFTASLVWGRQKHSLV